MPEDYHLFDSQQKRRFWQSHVEQWRQSGLRQSAYCRRHDLSAHRFYHWRRRILGADKSAVSFLPVALSASLRQHRPTVRIHTPNGFTIEVETQGASSEIRQLVAMVAAL